jgi:hypothetical protein
MTAIIPHVYVIKNKTNGKKYAGKSIIGVENRWTRHKSDARHGRLPDYFHNTIRKHGEEAFYIAGVIELGQPLIEGKTRKDISKVLCDIEKVTIKVQKLRNPQIGYNLTDGGDGVVGHCPTPETREKLCLAAAKQREEQIGIFSPGAASEAGRKGGLIAGRIAAESGHLVRIQQLPQAKEAQRAVGRRAVGKLASLRTPEHQAEAGRLGGLITGPINGPINGRKSFENRTGIHAPGIAAKSGLIGRHTRWHTRRNITDPQCRLCIAGQN